MTRMTLTAAIAAATLFAACSGCDETTRGASSPEEPTPTLRPLPTESPIGTPTPSPTAPIRSREVCDGLDNDLDGAVDEDNVNVAEESDRLCYNINCGVGECTPVPPGNPDSEDGAVHCFYGKSPACQLCKDAADCRAAFPDGPSGECGATECVNGGCELTYIADYTPCDDGVPITRFSTCQFGRCEPSQCLEHFHCEDGNPCTLDRCSIPFCSSEPISGEACEPELDCEDGNPCTNDIVRDGQCEYEEVFLRSSDESGCCWFGLAYEIGERLCLGETGRPAQCVGPEAAGNPTGMVFFDACLIDHGQRCDMGECVDYTRIPCTRPEDCLLPTEQEESWCQNQLTNRGTVLWKNTGNLECLADGFCDALPTFCEQDGRTTCSEGCVEPGQHPDGRWCNGGLEPCVSDADCVGSVRGPYCEVPPPHVSVAHSGGVCQACRFDPSVENPDPGCTAAAPTCVGRVMHCTVNDQIVLEHRWTRSCGQER